MNKRQGVAHLDQAREAVISEHVIAYVHAGDARKVAENLREKFDVMVLW